MKYATKMTKFERDFITVLNAKIAIARLSIRSAKTLETKYINKGKLESLVESKNDYRQLIRERMD